jgi:large subunit ribosomal protein L24
MKNPLINTKKSRAVHIDMAKAFNIVKGDLVQVLYGRDSGNTGVVSQILRQTNQVVVTGCNIVRSYRPSEAERQMNPTLPSQIAVEAPIHVTNVVPLDPVTKKPTRIKRRYSMSGDCVRISKVSGSAMPDPVPVSSSYGQRATRVRSELKAGVLRGAPIASRSLASWKNDQTQLESMRRLVISEK